jgi:hypothetical protein
LQFISSPFNSYFLEIFLSESAVVEIMMNQTAERSNPTILIVDNKVLSREFIQNHIWRDSQLYQYSRTVDVHVQRLR